VGWRNSQVKPKIIIRGLEKQSGQTKDYNSWVGETVRSNQRL
jgi:hypothetical protein